MSGPIDDLLVTVVFHRRLSKRLRAEFTSLIVRYVDSVRLRGAFGEGPVSLACSEIDYYTRVAQFRIDASRSGQNTINWLILSILAFSPLNPVLDVYFTEHPRDQPPVSSFEELLGTHEEDRIRFPIVHE